MMKYPIQPRTIASVLAGLVITSLLPTTSYARIGERRESIERRLFSSGGIVYRDDTIEESRRMGMPYTQYLEYLPSSSDVRIYFKTSDGRRPSSSELSDGRMSAGWDFFELISEANLRFNLNDEIPHSVRKNRKCFCGISDRLTFAIYFGCPYR